MYGFVPLEIAASGMEAQRVRMGIVASNLANANTTRGADGAGPYQRRVVRLRANTLPAFAEMLDQAGRYAGKNEIVSDEARSVYLAETNMRGVQVSGISRDPSVRVVHDPSHPDADAAGNVMYPEISVVGEMTDMFMASRQYEANLAVMKNTRDMLAQLIEMLRQ